MCTNKFQRSFVPFRALSVTVFLVLFFLTAALKAQPAFKGLEPLFVSPKSYVAAFAGTSPAIDGDITEAVWSKVPWTDLFKDIEGEGKPEPYYQTRAKMLWDKDYLYIAAEVQDPHIWANLHQHDEVVFHDNDFEVFLDPGNTTHQYFEIEVNALNTIFDLFMPKPYRNGSGALISWNTPGLKSAVKVLGTLNQSSDQDKAWTVEMAIPFSSVSMGNNATIPSDGVIWRINFSRVEWNTEIKDGIYSKKKTEKGRDQPENNWVWSPQGVINMHYPERWGYLQFSNAKAGEKLPEFQLPLNEKLRSYLWLAYYRQKDFLDKNKKYASSLSELSIEPSFILEGNTYHLVMESTSKQFTVTMELSAGKTLSITDEGLVRESGGR